MIADIQTLQPNGNPVRSLSTKALPTPANGWPFRPFQIVSLFEVLNNYAEQFYVMAGALKELEKEAEHLSPSARVQVVRDSVVESLLSSLRSVERACQQIHLTTSVMGVRRAQEQIAKGSVTWEEVGRIYGEVQRRIHDEVSAIRFFYVSANGLPYYPQKSNLYAKPLLSATGMKKFSRFVEDAEEAGKCFALGRYTACMFHLMRIMERGVQRLGKKLKVSINVEEKEWGAISNHITGAIKRLPNSTPKEKKAHARYAKAAVYLDNVREAWRNPTMHPKETYTEEEAQDAFSFVKQYMEYLTKIL